MKPFLKWAGGKRQLLSVIKQLVPDFKNRYWEPFLGGGALFFALRPERACLSDVNKELIHTYICVRDKPEELISVLRNYQRLHWEHEDKGKEKEFYNRVRVLNVERLGDVERAARFIYLNKTCWNGLYRVNKKGEFNVPMGRYRRPKICDEKNILMASKILRGKEIICADFEEVLAGASEGDFVYLDPPYFSPKGIGFTQYNEEDFTFEDHLRLARVFRELDEKGCYVLLSNSYSEEIVLLYENYNMVSFKTSRFINSDAQKRKDNATEILVANFPLKLSTQRKLFPELKVSKL